LREARFIEALELLAPGAPLREAVDSILQANTGGLIVIGDSEQVLSICEGGFEINVPFNSAALYELAKMDGAIILTAPVDRILKANVHLVPPAAIPSAETGIRHRIANRMARQTGALVIAISQRRSVITLYKGNLKYIFKDTGFILTKANQALQSLEKYKISMEKKLSNLSILEFKGVTSLHEVLRAVHAVEVVHRVAGEIQIYIAQLGSEGRLIQMQLDELIMGVEEEQSLLVRDYVKSDKEKRSKQVIASMRQCGVEELKELVVLSRILGYGGTLGSLDLAVFPRGYRLLAKVPRIPMPVIEDLVSNYGSLIAVMEADATDLVNVEGIGEVRARAIKDGIKRLQEHLMLDYYNPFRG